MLRRALALAAALLAASPAAAWNLFGTRSAAPATAVAPAGDAGLCVREILIAQERYGIPDNLLLAIGLQEAGVTHQGRLTVWPWAVNAAGEGRIFQSPQDALGWIRSRQAAGVESIDVGCMQINLRWHPDAFTSARQGLDAAVNVDYAARFLVRLHGQTGDWLTAAGSYHSFTPDKREIYLASLTRNIAVANERAPALAALAGAAPPAAARLAEAPAGPGIAWSTARDGARVSIYSAQGLQPVLPAFARAPS
ncbi:Hypothetical transmembrane protein [Oceanicola granulosus HTCC2516]|uniref:Hypothetical transmembrane protein n=1 Tax=Oceanicola granulosus (strain ATCC BAA-861 / DSM 15982 / KCTC 12143 / HTCC2516) TaxID=314256 RepID=Q2CGI8_OCEGH|nr:hypothetical protein [Oceanicola granulosus]EAR51730.1 Hypothetical transmembrane protein [Oceanicola granulosus HTCC2516]